ncbi:hypothetical protein AYJ66_17355 [Dietzia cinnamea]|nr:hypothetical protein AYJ66_17355 [Dietzia cinnamea]
MRAFLQHIITTLYIRHDAGTLLSRNRSLVTFACYLNPAFVSFFIIACDQLISIHIDCMAVLSLLGLFH